MSDNDDSAPAAIALIYEGQIVRIPKDAENVIRVLLAVGYRLADQQDSLITDLIMRDSPRIVAPELAGIESGVGDRDPR